MAFKDTKFAKSQRQPDPENRAHRGRWKPGVSGNPKGRNSDAFQLWQRAREYGPRVLEFLWSVVDGAYDDDHIPPKFSDKISAGREILDRGFGKPTQAFSVDGDGTDGKPVTFTLNISAPNGDKDRDN